MVQSHVTDKYPWGLFYDYCPTLRRGPTKLLGEAMRWVWSACEGGCVASSGVKRETRASGVRWHAWFVERDLVHILMRPRTQLVFAHIAQHLYEAVVYS